MIATTLILLLTIGAIGTLIVRDIDTHQYAIRLADEKEACRKAWGIDKDVVDAAQRWRARNQA